MTGGTVERRQRTIGVRVDAVLSARIKAAAAEHFDGNESILIRKATETYIALRAHLGDRFETVVGSFTPKGGDDRRAA
jgi:hypothetical protein